MDSTQIEVNQCWEHPSGHPYTVVAVARAANDTNMCKPTIVYRSMLTQKSQTSDMGLFLKKMKKVKA